ncbi:T9SS type B sorting domain-containing protein [Salegentibacter sp. F188]|uniref:T9SS type B sorting domain-containing protein n=1 Tax=Autumnicola patrickiae TaxID=3075591 RepID=A0ABU3E277_9FLAO|nr:T9SS type B sorting domain-containing protein [Salegentibacter sp. F188]MDT0690094.1 T9SS type B sorting domain-containing protein [Salegentibacter sp. F188]
MARLVFLLLFVFSCTYSFAQLGFCEGSKGDPIFQEDFGSGNGSGSPFPAGTTTYSYVTGDPQDGQYTISGGIGQQILSWHDFLPNTTLSSDRALIVNADFTSGQFFKTEISGLCENTSYEFSAYLINIYNRQDPTCPNGGIPINVRFEIWDETDTQLLKQGSTGDIASTTSPAWEQYALTFQSEAGQDAVILKMFNNGDGGCGNDLAIDDIIFRSCGDLTTVTSEESNGSELAVCESDAPVNAELNATPDYSIYENHVFQWQESEDGENWQNIEGATADNYSTGALSTSRYYRVKVAEDELNLANNLCSSASEAFYIKIVSTPDAPVSNGDQTACSGEPIPELSVQTEGDETANWYDAATGGNLIAENTVFFTPESAGIYYAEAKKANYDCEASARTALELIVYEVPQVEDENWQICAGALLKLDAGVSGMTYSWSTGESSQTITIENPGDYNVKITTAEGCEVNKNFEVAPTDVAAISNISSDENTVTIEPENTGSFEYSLDGINFQNSNIFTGIPGGIYTAYIRDLNGCATFLQEFPHIVVPKFITPNNDGYNDTFSLNGLDYFSSSEIRIFDRFGKLLKTGNGEDFSWNGIFEGNALPASDYWYQITIEGFKIIKGHFSLVR